MSKHVPLIQYRLHVLVLMDMRERIVNQISMNAQPHPVLMEFVKMELINTHASVKMDGRY